MKPHARAFTLLLATASFAPRAAFASGALVKGPYLTALPESGVDVRFELAVPAAASVEVTLEGAPASSPVRMFRDLAPSAFHLVHATGLEPATRYAYVVRTGNASAEPVGKGSFSTAPRLDSTAALTFLVYGDNRTDAAAHQAVVNALLGVSSDFLVNTGDLVQDGSSAEDWRSFFEIESALLRDRAIFVAIGNHELYDDSAGANFARYFGFFKNAGAGAQAAPRPYGTIRLGSVRFFFLNGMDDWAVSDERTWLERALSDADAEPDLLWRIGVIHHGPWSSGPHGPNTRLIEAHIPALLAAHKMDLLFSGHDHLYERGDSGLLKYVLSGGGGAPLYPVGLPSSQTRKAEAVHHFVEVVARADSIRITAHRLDGSLLEQCGFPKNGAWDCDISPTAGTAVSAATRTVGGSSLPGPSPEVSTSRGGALSRCGCNIPGAPSIGPPAGAFAVWPPLLLFWASGALAFAGRRRRG